jgi:hypothetical protein
MARENSNSRASAVGSVTIKLPAPTAWPIILAFGIALLLGGLVTSPSVGILGAILLIVGCVGWFNDVLPQEKEEILEVKADAIEVTTTRRDVERLPVAPELTRALLPLETYPVIAGIKGGLAGSVAMAVLACLYGILRQGSIWYPINLLAATVYAQSLQFGTASLHAFHLNSFLLASLIHLITSLLVGLLYGAMLPMIPRRPILLGGVIAPILWTGFLYSILGLINPLMNERIDWRWFVASQFAFGIVAGLVVVRHHRVPIPQFMAIRPHSETEGPSATRKKGKKDKSE